MQKTDEQSRAAPHGMRETIRFYLIDSNSALGKTVEIAIVCLNLFIVSIFIISTYPLSEETLSILTTIELVVVGIFIAEYCARLYGAEKQLKHLYNPYNIIDLIAILPSLLQPFIGPGHIGTLKLLRMFRVFRVLRFLRFFETTDFFFGRISHDMLKILRLCMTIFMIFFVSSGLFYLAEFPKNQMVQNFGDAFYFTVVALTTVGFGDIIPISGAGKAVTILCILSGIALIPWQVGEIVHGWIHIAHKHPVTCQHCGLMYHDQDAIHCKACGSLIYQETDYSK
jgi:voltage-gated potassium channel